MDIADIARAVRAGIKADIKAGTLPQGKYSVRLDRFAGGQSLRIEISGLQTHKLIVNPLRAIWERDNPHETPFDQPRKVSAPWTTEGERILKHVESLANAYNFDGSDSQSDYFDVNFYLNVQYDWDFREAQKKLILENI
jgi:hypothetical protein